MGVFAELAGQDAAIQTLRRAAQAATAGGAAMSHAWLITGPPGSGRSNAARAFAAALQCEQLGCGECTACNTSLSGAHPDVTLVNTEMLSIGVDEVRDLVRRSAMSPTLRRFQVIVVEDADRITDRGADALLKSIEEPPPKTVWLLCAPTPEDVVVTVRSRCRKLALTTPTDAAIARLLVERDGIAPAMAAFAARASGGHIGRARGLATDESTRIRRREAVLLPTRLGNLGDCINAAQNLVADSLAAAKEATVDRDAAETAALKQALGVDTKGVKARNAAAALKDLEEQQKARLKRLQRDNLDRVLTELTTWYRDVLTVQLGADTQLINADVEAEVRDAAHQSNPVRTADKLEAIIACRRALMGSVAPQSALESMLISLAELA